jgi:uncharacterized protein
MTVILDTNILLICLPKASIYRLIFDALVSGVFKLAISNEILSEYIEILSQKTNATIANNVAELLLSLPNVVKTDVYFRWNLIRQDADDNKFVDCAIASAADFIVSNDRHFRELLSIDFPKVSVLTATQFLEFLRNENF